MASGRSIAGIPPLLVPVALSQFLISLDFSCMAIVIPMLAKATKAEPALLQWTISGTSLVWGGCLILGGRISDRFGNRRIFAIGLAIYMAGALICAAAPSVPVVIAGRVLAGLGGALFGPAILAALIEGSAEGERRNRALVVYSVAQALGSALGVAFGGLLAAAFGWRMIFAFNLAVAASAMLAATALPRPAARETSPGGGFDFAGAALVTSGCALLVLAFSSLGRAGFFFSMAVVAPAVAAVALLVLLVAVETRAVAPILPPSLFRVPGIAPALTVSMATNAAMAGLYYILATFLQQLAGFGAGDVGMIFMVKLVGVFIAGALMTRLLRGRSPWKAMAVGCLATALIALGLIGISIASALWVSIVAVALIPFGHMAAVISTAGEVTGRAPAEHRGVASAILLAGTQIGVALAMGLYASALGRSGAATPDVPAGFASVAAVAAIGLVMALVTAWRRRREDRLAPAYVAQP